MEALAMATARLQAAGVEGASGDARRLLAHALGVDALRVTLLLADPLENEAERRFLALVDQRAERRPVAQIIGVREFYGRSFIVTPDVLDPRPETEHLVEAALEEAFTSVLDLGTGSGMILATLLAERLGAEGQGVDISPAALTVARRNLDTHAPRGKLSQSDWFSNVSGRFDLIVSNPPYLAESEMAGLAPELAFEPRIALSDQRDGLSAYRIIAAQAQDFLAPQGRVIVEIGTAQGQAVSALFAASGWQGVEIRQDYSGHDRIVLARR